MYEYKTCILPVDILNTGKFHFNCEFEHDTESPFGYYVTDYWNMCKDNGKWHCSREKDFYTQSESVKHNIENQVNLIKSYIGNPYFINKLKRNDEYTIHMVYDIFEPLNMRSKKAVLIKPNDCRVKNIERQSNVRNVAYLPEFVKERVRPWCSFVIADYYFNTKNGADCFYEEMNILIQMSKIWHYHDMNNFGR